MPRQPHLVPPPITFSAEAFYGERVLQEFSGDLALVLWKTLRSVGLWIEGTRSGASEVFSLDAAATRKSLTLSGRVAAEVAEPLNRITELLQTKVPTPASLAANLAEVSDWASAEGATHTALEFMQAAALVEPTNAAAANQVGRFARQVADHPRAESWYRQAIFVARQSQKWEVFASAWLGIGAIHLFRGNFPAAERANLRGLRAAKRHGLRPLVAAAHHDLAVVGIRTRKQQKVVRHAGAAVDAYGPGHVRLPALAHDVAAFWTASGYFFEALRVFNALPAFTDVRDRLTLAASKVRAAGGAGDTDVFRDNWRQAVRLLRDPKTAERAATAWLDMAFGADLLGAWGEARTAADRAYAIAKERGENAILLKSEALIQSFSSSSNAPREGARKEAPTPVDRFSVALAAAVGAEAAF